MSHFECINISHLINIVEKLLEPHLKWVTFETSSLGDGGFIVSIIDSVDHGLITMKPNVFVTITALRLDVSVQKKNKLQR